jgi:hypothetical protein
MCRRPPGALLGELTLSPPTEVTLRHTVLMNVPTLSKLVAVDVRQVWPMEATSFTPWLLENADVLGEALGMDLLLETAEHKEGYSRRLIDTCSARLHERRSAPLENWVTTLNSKETDRQDVSYYRLHKGSDR